MTSTSKTLNWSVTQAGRTNAVNTTIESSPGFNAKYLKRIPGILKILELILAATALGLIAYMRWESRPLERDVTKESRLVNSTGIYPAESQYSFLRESFLVGEVYFLCAHTAALTMVVCFLLAYLFHTVSSMIVPKTSVVESVINTVLGLMLIAAGIVQLVMTEQWKSETANGVTRALMTDYDYGVRIAAGVLALINGILFLVSAATANKELAGPKTM